MKLPYLECDAKALKRVIKLHLAENDLTASQFARSLDVSPSYMSAVINGKKQPTDAILAAVGFRRVVTVQYLPL